MASQSDFRWIEYYQKLEGRQPRPLLTLALASFEEGTSRQAIDLGCGDGTETLALIEQGWHVLAIDREPDAIRRVEEKIPVEKRSQLQTQIASFATAQLVEADLVYAALSLPFCPPEHFDAVWKKVSGAIRPGGRFAGHFFGDRDTWAANPGMTCLPRTTAEALFDAFEIETFDENEGDHPTALGEPKHWHTFEVIARKK